MNRTHADPFTARARHDVSDARFIRVRCACGVFHRKAHAMAIPCTVCRQYVTKATEGRHG